MKKLITLSLLSLCFSSMAATQADLVLKGLVAPILDISISHEANASLLDLSQPANDVKVATLTEKSNYALGYKIKAKSTNAGKLAHPTDANSFVNYTLKYDGLIVPLTNSPTLVKSHDLIKGTNNRILRITYTQPNNLSAGLHEDTVQFTIEAN